MPELRSLAEIREWYNQYFTVPGNIGFVAQQTNLQHYKEKGDGFQAHEAEQKITQVLFFRLRRSEVRIENNAGKATINAAVPAGLRGQTAQQLLTQSSDFLSGLDI